MQGHSLRYTLKTGFTVLCDVCQRDVPLLGEIQHNTCIIMYVMLLNIELEINISEKFPNIYLVFMKISLVKRTCTLSHIYISDTYTQSQIKSLNNICVHYWDNILSQVNLLITYHHIINFNDNKFMKSEYHY